MAVSLVFSPALHLPVPLKSTCIYYLSTWRHARVCERDSSHDVLPDPSRWSQSSMRCGESARIQTCTEGLCTNLASLLSVRWRVTVMGFLTTSGILFYDVVAVNSVMKYLRGPEAPRRKSAQERRKYSIDTFIQNKYLFFFFLFLFFFSPFFPPLPFFFECKFPWAQPCWYAFCNFRSCK